MAAENIIVIDGQDFLFTPGETILQIAGRNGIDIPTLCYLKGASPTGRCRICQVEVQGKGDLASACETAAESNMVVRTETPRVVRERRANLESLLASGQHNCLVQDMDMDSWTDFQLKAMEPKEHETLCPAYGTCRLQDLAIQYRVRTSPQIPQEPRYTIENVNPFIVRDFSRCIVCGRCVKACNEIQVNNAISFGYEPPDSKIVTEGDLPLKDSNCVFCGECVQVCPVGALVPKRDFEMDHSLSEAKETKKVRSVCSYCGVGCQIYLHVRDGKVVKVTGVEDVGPNYGSLCVKGRFGYDFIDHPDRLKTPLIRDNGKFKEASWDEALKLVAGNLTRIKQESGPDSIGVLTSARATNEDNYLAQKFARAVIGTNNVDHCARL